MSIVLTPPIMCKFGGFHDVNSIDTTDDMQIVGVSFPLTSLLFILSNK